MPSRHVILSPHADDAVWSLGGAIAMWREDREVLILTVFDGPPLSPSTPHRPSPASASWRGISLTPLRRREDAAAAEMLGVRRHSLDLPEAALRQDLGGAFEVADPGALFAPEDAAGWPTVPPALISALTSWLEPGDTVLAPLAVGRHLDHCLVHRAACQACPPEQLHFYPEFPYADPLQEPQLLQHLSQLGLPLLPHSLTCAARHWHQWRRAASLYRSQIVRLFGGGRVFIRQLAAFAALPSVPQDEADTVEVRQRIWSIRAR